MSTPDHPLMSPREKATELTREFAIKGKSPHQIRKQLDQRGLHGALEAFEIEQLVHEGRAAASLLPPKPSFLTEVHWWLEDFRMAWLPGQRKDR